MYLSCHFFSIYEKIETRSFKLILNRIIRNKEKIENIYSTYI